MKTSLLKNSIALTASLALMAVSNLSAATHYVSLGSTNPKLPYTNWVTAARNIQDAVKVAATNDVVLVTNGVYPGGVTVTNPLTLLSVNGPQVTVIDGGGTNLCIFLRDGASLTGFTLRNGSGYDAGGVVCTSTNVFVTNCVISGNGGGGAYRGTYYNCTLSANPGSSMSSLRANWGGGASAGILYNCTLSDNVVVGYWLHITEQGIYCPGTGGGAYGCTLYNCTLTGNSAPGGYGGGAFGCTLYNCTLTGNSAPTQNGYLGSGGGADGCTLYNCTVAGNSADYGGGADNCTLYNCTVAGNSADDGDGVDDCTLYNCIVYFNTAPGEANYDASCTLNYCCTTPLPTNGVGNISVDPQLADASHITSSSPCRGAGSAAYAIGTDIDGEPWGNPPSIGCDEYHAGLVTGPLAASVSADYTNVAAGYTVNITGQVNGRASANSWDFGDGTVVSNRVYASHAWAAPGAYTVLFRAYNDSVPSGVSATLNVHVFAPVLYVAATNTNPQPPYTTWSTAATSIQDAINTTVAGARIVVSNGVYAGGITVTYPLALESANGPQFTVIDGGGAVQCVSLTDGASLSGFTLTNGWDNTGNGGGGVWSASTHAFLTNCMIVGNSAQVWGGGACRGTLYNCTLTANSAEYGGGANSSTLYNCTLIANSGFGAVACTTYNCTLTGNAGGGAGWSTLYNCTLTANSGDGADYCTLYDCALAGNSGLGALACTLYNCTLTGNAGGGAGTAWDYWDYCPSTLYNCIVYYNGSSFAANYDADSVLNYCCTTPLPTNGVGNIALDPQLASASHLSADSPCIGAGSAAHASGTDIDGEPWLNPPSIGCDEFHHGAVTGPLTVSIQANYTNVAVGHALSLTALIGGRPTDSIWDFGDGDIALNEPYITHTWTEPGEYRVTLWAFNESNPDGVQATQLIHFFNQPVICVAMRSPNPQPPYLSWSTAATNIQDALNEWFPGASVFVTNGAYAGGLNCTNPVQLLSVNGPQVTVIDGAGTNKCISLPDGASLTGFTLTNGWDNIGNGGGGVWCASANAFLTNCVIAGSSAQYGGACGGTLYNCALTGNFGGGAWNCTLYNCTLTGNSVSNGGGGGAYSCTLNNCTLSGNSASAGGGVCYCTVSNCMLTENSASDSGGGAYVSTLYNCTLMGNVATNYCGGVASSALYNSIAYFNSSPDSPNYDPSDPSTTLNYCDTTPHPANGAGNIPVPPQFVDYAHGNLRLQSNSPCINSGNNTYVTTATDMDGNPRVVSGTVDIGAYEYQGTGSRISYAWLQQYGLPTDGSVDYADLDGSGFNVYQDWVAGLNPTNRLSVLRVVSVVPHGTNVAVTWQSVVGVNYFLERGSNLKAPFTLLATNVLGQVGTTSYADTNAPGAGPFFYRVGVNAD
jgi:parallel beta-helix repeat protein